MIAQWGDIVFSVNSDKIFSFRNMKYSYAGRWTTHNISGCTPLSEFLGPDLDELSMEVVLDTELGVDPRSAMEAFKTAAKRGTVASFYIGGKKLSDNRWILKSGSEQWDKIWNNGVLTKATAQLTFQEYA